VNAVAAAVLLLGLAAAVRAIARTTRRGGAESAFERALEPPGPSTREVAQLSRLERAIAESRAGELHSGLRDQLLDIADERLRRRDRRELAREPAAGSLEEYVSWLEEL
jgi:hypothetical protein